MEIWRSEGDGRYCNDFCEGNKDENFEDKEDKRKEGRIWINKWEDGRELYGGRDWMYNFWKEIYMGSDRLSVGFWNVWKFNLDDVG